jgi:hypothetical protein
VSIILQSISFESANLGNALPVPDILKDIISLFLLNNLNQAVAKVLISRLNRQVLNTNLQPFDFSTDDFIRQIILMQFVIKP